MSTTSLSAALTHEHREIDAGIESFVGGLARGVVDSKPLLVAFEALRRHIYLEETFLFPPLKEAGMAMPVFVMLREHGELWDAMEHLDALLASDAAPQTVQNACRELLAKLDQHNSKEEPIIYPQADAKLTPEAASELRAFIGDGRLPASWRCEKASA
jgi:hemerythrin-like domain-containing protein